MARLARRYFSIPATSVRSEEIFSVAGNILSEKRNRLLPENVDKLVFYMKICDACKMMHTLHNYILIINGYFLLCTYRLFVNHDESVWTSNVLVS